MVVAVFAYTSEFGATEAALEAAEIGLLAEWQPGHAATATADRTGRLKVTATAAIAPEPDTNSWWTLLVAVLAQGPLGKLRGVSTGALWGSLLEYGVDDRFLRSVVEAMVPGASGWFLEIASQHVPALKDYAADTDATLHMADIPPEMQDELVRAIATAHDDGPK